MRHFGGSARRRSQWRHPGRTPLLADNAFKSYPLFYIFYCMTEKWDVSLSASFFAPHHGWSLCDTHFGHSKKKVRQQFRTSIIEKPENIIDIFKQFNNVTVEILVTIQERKVETNFFVFKEGITEYFHFEFRNSFEVIVSPIS
jgi:hypothetical protein